LYTIHPQFSCEEGIEGEKKKKNSRDHRFHPDHNKRIEVGIATENFFKKQKCDPIRGEEEGFTHHQKTKPRKKTKQTPPSLFSETTSYGSIPFAVLVWNGALWRLETSTGIIGCKIKAPSYNLVSLASGVSQGL
jgi:hypothetical protein